ncbi:MAG: (Fe-S)-binding protein [Candidatus Alcyoniella australis]|nr:(Fe-S)-binding protein [Candidatus Alcyoniella australis]
MEYESQRFFEPYDPKLCQTCGRCLAECDVMRLSLDQAKAEIERLRAGETGEHVPYHCETCFACSLRCEHNANPASLFRASFTPIYEQQGLPAWSAYFQPHQPHNFRQAAADDFNAEERELVQSWARLDPAEEICYPGCNVVSLPLLTKSALFEGLDIRGGYDYCCGETLFRQGLEDQLRGTARRLNQWLEQMGTRKMTILCTAGYNIFRHVLPRYGLTRELEITPYLELIDQGLESGRWKVVRPLEMTVTLQDSCYTKLLGPRYAELPRRILRRIGVDVREMPHCRENSYCCGIGAGFPIKISHRPDRMVLGGHRVLAEARSVKADALGVYCAGCQMMLSAMRHVSYTSKPIYHLIEMVQMAIGEQPARRIGSRSRALLLGTLRRQGPALASRKRLRPEPIEPLD